MTQQAYRLAMFRHTNKKVAFQRCIQRAINGTPLSKLKRSPWYQVLSKQHKRELRALYASKKDNKNG